MKKLLIVDALNFFIRSFIVDPSLNISGSPVGGIRGTLKSLQKTIRLTKPDEIVFVWDGPGGSRKRRAIHKEYKEGRKPIRLNRNTTNLSDEEEQDNKNWQQIRLFQYLNEFPIIQFMEADVEADDLISLVSKNEKYVDWYKIIVSSDKDFYQLCNNKTILYRPIQNKIETEKTIVAEFGIHPNNFAIARSLAGDRSDNIDGIGGAGLKTIIKNLPFLVESKSYLIDDIEKYCLEKIQEKSKLKFFYNFVDNLDKVKTNYSITQLYSPNISVQVANKVRYTIDNFKPELNITAISKFLSEDGIVGLGMEEMFADFRRIIKDHAKN